MSDENSERETDPQSDQSVDSTEPPKFRVRRIVIGLSILFGLFLTCCVGNLLIPEVVIRLTSGWFYFLRDSGSRIQIVWSDVLFSICLMAAFVFGFHSFMRRMLSSSSETTRWKWRSTFAVSAGAILLFVTSICMIGLTHQMVWMTTSDEPSVKESFMTHIHTQRSLKQLGEAVHDSLPERGSWSPLIVDKNGAPLHGWPAQLLAHLPQGSDLHSRIDFEQSWKHESNRNVFQTRVKIFEASHRELPLTEDGFAPIRVSGNAHVLNAKSFGLRWVTDGTANTLLMGEIDAHLPAWGHPLNWRDPAIGLNRSPFGFGSTLRREPVGFTMGDGSVRFLSEEIDPAVLRALSTPRWRRANQ